MKLNQEIWCNLMIPVFCSNPLTPQPDLGSVFFQLRGNLRNTEFLNAPEFCAFHVRFSRVMPSAWNPFLYIRTAFVPRHQILWSEFCRSKEWREGDEHKGKLLLLIGRPSLYLAMIFGHVKQGQYIFSVVVSWWVWSRWLNSQKETEEFPVGSKGPISTNV